VSLCLIAAGKTTAIAATAFTLAWEHSVEHTAWQESWRIEPGGLVLDEARVKGSGAGMDPGPGARLVDGWWVWTPALPPQPELHRAASGATAGGWRLCAAGSCREIGAEPGATLVLLPCPRQR
jgi:hypothetical protein